MFLLVIGVDESEDLNFDLVPRSSASEERVIPTLSFDSFAR